MRASSSRWVARGALALALVAPGVLAGSTSAIAQLPDGRAHELVSRPQKLADLTIGSGVPYAWVTADGSRVLYLAALADAPSGDLAQPQVASRRSTAWETTPVDSAGDPGDYTVNTGKAGPVAPDLSRLAEVAVPGGAVNLNYDLLPSKLYVARPGGASAMLASFAGDVFNLSAPRAVAATEDLTHVLYEEGGFADPAALDPPAPGLVAGAYQLAESMNGSRKLVATNPDGSPLSSCGAVAGNGPEVDTYSYLNVMSADGSKVFFRAPDPGQSSNGDPACSQPSQLYVREGSAAPRLISAPDVGVSDPGGPQPAYFAGASRDGDKAFFVTEEQLTADDAPGSGKDLYLYDVSSHQLRLVTRAPDGTANAGVEYVMTSDDGSTAYVLVQRPMVAGTGVDGQPNLYRYDVETGTWSFIATLAADDANHLTPWAADYHGVSAQSGWYTTSSGQFLLFKATLDLLHGGVQQGAAQLYRYDADKAELTCVSCVAGVTPTGDARWGYGSVPPYVSRYNRPMSDDGTRVFFDTPDQLVPADANHARDVYEWHDGEVSLLSGGVDRGDSALITASADGHDVFFSTRQQLVGDDHDDYVDIYDARIGGGFGTQAPDPQCSGATCSAPASAIVTLDAPSSSRLSGSGNLAVPPPRVRHAVRITGLRVTQRGRAARTGVLAIQVRTSAAGSLRITARARLGSSMHRVARASRTVHGAGTVVAHVRLGARARRVLAHHLTLTLSVTVALSGASQRRTLSVSLRRPR